MIIKLYKLYTISISSPCNLTSYVPTSNLVAHGPQVWTIYIATLGPVIHRKRLAAGLGTGGSGT